MIPLTEPKIAGLTPRWAPFPGFSLLLDAPETAYRREGGLETLVCDPEGDPSLGFYGRVHGAFRALDPGLLLRTYGLCALPPDSYHVTAFDVANVADLVRCHATTRDGLRATLDRLPSTEAFDDPLLRAARLQGGLEFRYGELCLWGRVIVVRLEPIDGAAFAAFKSARTALSRLYREGHGVGAGEGYTPHLSLGYFMDATGAELARARLVDWGRALREALGDERLAFASASLHGFTDMATFFRRPVARPSRSRA